MFATGISKPVLFASLLSWSSSSPVTREVTEANVIASYHTLQQWYNSSIGIWSPSTGWWNSANCLTVIANLASVDISLKFDIISVISNTYTQAQIYNSQMVKIMGAADQPFLMQTFYADHGPPFPESLVSTFGQLNVEAGGGFLNGYYDDEGWWALAWIAAYDLTRNPSYLTQAESIFADMNAVFGKTNCANNSGGTGGIWWDKAHGYVNAIANELFLAVAASLANRAVNSNIPYLDIAKQQWAWFQGSGMIGANNTINDGLDQNTCKNNGGTVWTYNQGVILGGLVELSKASGDLSLIKKAQDIGDAAIALLAPGGILTEPCENPTTLNNCGGDGSQFKGVFVRNIAILQRVSPQDRYKTFLKDNADSIWQHDRNANNELSLKWAGPFVTPAYASTHSSAMDGLIAALLV